MSHINSSSTITTPKGHANITETFFLHNGQRGPLSVVHQMSIDSVHWTQVGGPLYESFREHRRDVINGRNDLPVPAHFSQANHTMKDIKVAVLMAGLANQEYLDKQKARLIFKCRTGS